jgi:hypothetical protein
MTEQRRCFRHPAMHRLSSREPRWTLHPSIRNDAPSECQGRHGTMQHAHPNRSTDPSLLASERRSCASQGPSNRLGSLEAWHLQAIERVFHLQRVSPAPSNALRACVSARNTAVPRGLRRTVGDLPYYQAHERLSPALAHGRRPVVGGHERCGTWEAPALVQRQRVAGVLRKAGGRRRRRRRDPSDPTGARGQPGPRGETGCRRYLVDAAPADTAHNNAQYRRIARSGAVRPRDRTTG